MKKTLIALAAVAVSSAAFAQVTMYGVVDVGYGTTERDFTAGDGSGTSVKDFKSTTKSTGAHGQQSGSRIGFRGTEEIGSLKAGFVYELGVAPTKSTGFADMSNRQAFASLAGGFGEVRIGRQYTGLFQINAKYDVGGTVAGAGYLPSSAQLGDTAWASAIRSDNVVSYTSPTVAGFQVGLSMLEDTSKNDNKTLNASAPASLVNDRGIDNKVKGTTIGLSFDQGPISAMVAYTQASAATLGDAGNSTAGRIDRLAASAADNKQTRTNVGASYNLGVAKVSVTHNIWTVDSKLESNIDTSYSDTNVGVSVPMGPLTLWASTGTGSLKADSDVTAVGTTANQTKGKLVSYKAHQIGASYALSKRTNIYAFTGMDEGKRKQTQADVTNAATNKQTVGAKTVNTSTHVGIRHSF